MTDYNYEKFGCHHISQGRVLKKEKQAVEHPHLEETMRGVAKPMEPVDHIVQGARAYASLKGMKDPHASGYHHVRQTPDRIRELAKHYDALPLHDKSAEPAFHAMRKEVNDQFHHLTKTMGVKAEFVDHDPYKNSHEMAHDLRQNKTIKVLRTAKTGGHPLFSDEENDKFRAVHDAFGHAGTGRDFDGHGEEAAWLAHHKMFSHKAQGALASETRGQNGSVIAHSQFGPQKIALMPKHLWTPDSSHEAMLVTAGANGPDYKGLEFRHKFEDETGNGEGEGSVTAHHKDAVHGLHNPEGKVGTLTYQRLNHFGDDGFPQGNVVHVDMLKTHFEHKRRGVASQLMNELERKHPDTPIDHGTRTPAGKAWADKHYGPTEYHGGESHEDPDWDVGHHEPKYPTLNGKYLAPAHSSVHRREVVKAHLASFDKVASVSERVAVLIREAVKDKWIQYDLPSMIRLGHVSGNQVDVIHCPFCGSGSLVARSDGTVECGFCTAVFTVQVQPQYAAFPQTVEGQPYPWPGRPNDFGQVAPDAAGDQGIGADPMEAEEDAGAVPGEEVDPEDAEEDDDDEQPDFMKKSYRTAKGNVLDRDKYIAHIAIVNSRHRQRVVAGMRG